MIRSTARRSRRNYAPKLTRRRRPDRYAAQPQRAAATPVKTRPPLEDNARAMAAAIHEMRNHLCVAMASIEAFIDRKLEPSDARLNAVFATLHDVDLLINDLPNERFAQRPARASFVNPCAVITSGVAAMEGYAAQCGVVLSIVSRSATNAPAAHIAGDPVRIAEIITNLLINAIRYTPSCGRVHVECSRDATDFRFSVADGGPGIRSADRSRIFVRGYSGGLFASAAGSGIGLALVKQFVDGQNGTIQVENGPLGGAVFTVTFPLRPMFTAPASRRQRATDACPTSLQYQS